MLSVRSVAAFFGCVIIVDGCSFLVANFEVGDELLVGANRLNRLRGPDVTTHVTIRGWTLVHNLLWMTGEFTKQPFVQHGPNGDVEYAVVFNGEVYNYHEILPTRRFPSDGYAILPAYHEWGSGFGEMLDGEFAIVLFDFQNGKLHLLTDVFGTKPLFYGWGANGEFAAASYRSVLTQLGFAPDRIYQAAANTMYSADLDRLQAPFGGTLKRTSLRAAAGEGETSLATGSFLVQHPVFQFDLRQHKQTSDDWIEAFQRAVAKRTRGLLWPAFVGLSSGYDSGAIHLALILANISHQTFTIMGYEDRHLLQLREEYGKGNLHTGIRITEDSRTRHMEWLAENVESFEYVHPSHGQNVHSDAASLGLSHILERCRGSGVKVYFSGSGADETISDYAVNGTACCKGENGVLTFNFNGTFPQDLSSIFPWGNFYSGQMKNYLMKEENVGGSYGMETRYPFLDRELVQEYISLSADFKNSRYKRPIRDFFLKHDIITGIFVESAMSVLSPDSEMLAMEHNRSERDNARKLEQMCRNFDHDESGKLTQEQFEDSLRKKQLPMFLTMLGLGTHHVLELFNDMTDDNGQVDIGKFVDGCMLLKGAATNFELQKLQAEFRTAQVKLGQGVDLILDLLTVCSEDDS